MIYKIYDIKWDKTCSFQKIRTHHFLSGSVLSCPHNIMCCKGKPGNVSTYSS